MEISKVVPSGRLRYSREEVLALKDSYTPLNFPINSVPPKPTRQGRKKSQSSDLDSNVLPAHNDHNAINHNGFRRGRHPASGKGHGFTHQQHSGNSFGPRQRNVSGPHTDINDLTGANNFKPNSTDKVRGSQGDWSKGCAGWRQRSYSGSENFVMRPWTYHSRGRGMNTEGFTDEEPVGLRGRGRGRGFVHRGGAPLVTGSRRPASQIHQNFDFEKDFQHENEIKLESVPDKQTIQMDSKPQTRHPSSEAVPAESVEITSVTKGISKMRIHSQSCSFDPPPGFEPTFQIPNPPETSDNTATSPTLQPAPHTRRETQWYYIDSSGHVQGPFGNEQMANWLGKSYLPLQIEVRRDCDECFLPLLTHLTLAGRIPFWNGYSQSPITRSNLASILLTSGTPLSSPQWSNQPPLSTPLGGAGDVVIPAPQLVSESKDSSSGFSPTVPKTTLTGAINPPTCSPQQIPDSSSTSVLSNTEILRLCSEAQALAIHAAKVEAERQELAERLSAISTTAAKLLASPANHPRDDERVLQQPISPTQTTSVCVETAASAMNLTVTELEPISETSLERTVEQSNDVANTVSPCSNNDSKLEEPADTKKNKKKNKKPKKNKLTLEEERQLAWEAEFERRRAAALAKKLAEEEEERRLAEEQAKALAEEQAAIAKEQKRLLKEQRKQELLQANAEKELARLKLPSSARWGTSTEPVGFGAASVGLTEIQAAQELEEARLASQQFMAQQSALLMEAEKKVTVKNRPNAWASVASGDTQMRQPVVDQRPVQVNKPSASSKTEFPAIKPTKGGKASKSADQPPAQTVRPPKASAAKKSNNTRTPQPKVNSPPAVSIWDLPVGPGTQQPIQSKSKSSKKNKKNKSSAPLDEAMAFAAKEQLAHWCESQLSSLPMSGVDLPTLVDLLCELETADQVVEFIESSLGKSALISKFSQAFLEKRACILHATL